MRWSWPLWLHCWRNPALTLKYWVIFGLSLICHSYLSLFKEWLLVSWLLTLSEEVYLSLCNQRIGRIIRQRLPCLRCWIISWMLLIEVKLPSLLCWTRAPPSIRFIMLFYLIVWRHDFRSLVVFLLDLSRISSIEGSQSVLRESRPVLFFCLLVFLKDPFCSDVTLYDFWNVYVIR